MDELAQRREKAATREAHARHVERIERLARIEDMRTDDLIDAVRQLACDHPVTEAAVLELVEEHGLKGACEALATVARD